MTDILLPKNALTVIRGESKTVKLSVFNPDGSPKNIVSGRLIMSVKKTVRDTTALIQKTTDVATEILITRASAGEAEIYLQPSDTKHLDIREYIFDVWLVITENTVEKRYAVITPSIIDLQPGVTVL